MTRPLTDAEIDAELAQLPGWSRAGDAIRRQFQFADFRQALAFMVRVGFCAEALGHHPELHNVYNRVTLTLTTHDAGNRVTAKDLALAREVSALLD